MLTKRGRLPELKRVDLINEICNFCIKCCLKLAYSARRIEDILKGVHSKNKQHYTEWYEKEVLEKTKNRKGGNKN